MNKDIIPMPIALPQNLQGDPAWRAVWHLLVRAFPNHPNVWQHVDLKNGNIYFKKILSGNAWSGGEARLLTAAASMFNEETSVNLWDLFCGLDEKNRPLVFDAIRIGWPET